MFRPIFVPPNIIDKTDYLTVTTLDKLVAAFPTL